jgi:hypothetical protein
MVLRKTAFIVAVGMFACLAVTLAAGGTTVTLTDMNTVVKVDVGPDSPAGMSSWTVDGQNHLNRQWFWYRVGDAGPERPLETLGTPTILCQIDRVLMVSYAGQQLTTEVAYMLTGGTPGSRLSDIAEQIRFVNTGSTSLQMHFWQYSDFDFEGTPEGDTIRINGNTVNQAGESLIVSETVVTPRPSHFEAALFGDTLARLTDGLPTTLNDVAGPLTGNVTWAYEWDFTLPARGTYIISKDKLIDPVPEPATLVTVSLGLAAVVARLRRRQRA